MKLEELRIAFLQGGVDKRLYWQIVRENYTHVLPQLQRLVKDNDEIESVELRKDGIVLNNASGVRLYFDFRQAVCRAEVELLMEGNPEKNDMLFINEYLSEHENGCILDIGANVGIFSLDFYQHHNKLKYYLFEPVPNTFQWLLKNAILNQVDDERYLPFNIGMSDKKGCFDFYVPASNEAASLVVNEDEFYRKKATVDGDYTGDMEIDKVCCTVDMVDGFVVEHNIHDIILIKIDVEGNELNVLHGAEKALREYKPLVYCELLRKHAKRFGYHPNDVIKYMVELGYVCKTMRNGELIVVDEITDETIETNFFFITE